MTDQVPERRGRKVVVLHTSYGCQTGCCGHVVRFADEADWLMSGRFEFEHADGPSEEQLKEYAEDLIRAKLGPEHVKDLDWEHSEVYDLDCPMY